MYVLGPPVTNVGNQFATILIKSHQIIAKNRISREHLIEEKFLFLYLNNQEKM